MPRLSLAYTSERAVTARGHLAAYRHQMRSYQLAKGTYKGPRVARLLQ